MSAKIIDGKAISADIKNEALKEAESLIEKGVEPCLAVVLVGNNSASRVYVNNKKKACEYCKIKSLSYELPEETTEEQLLELIAELNENKNVNGILVQLPLPKHIDETKVILAISENKDVDCFHPYNVGAVFTGGKGFKPCTPAGVIELIKRTGCDIAGKNCVVIGRSNIVGKPAAMLLMAENGTVTICHSKTKNMAEICKNADIIVVVAFGQILPESILNMPKYGCVNVHGSLLPKYRGAAPIQWSVINGDKETGVTTMYMEKGLDTGDMLLKASFEITEDDTYGSVHDKMCVLGADVLKETLVKIENGTIEREKQNDALSNYAPMISKDTGHIDWNKTSDEIINLIRGLDPVPAAWTVYNGEVLKIWKAVKYYSDNESGKCGEISYITKKGFAVKTGDGFVLVTEIQARGGKRMATDAYMRGHAIEKGIVLE